MVRRFAVGSPADLMALDAMKKSGACVSVAKVWGAAKNRGGAGFDGRVFVAFYTDHRPARRAVIFRLGIDNEVHEFAELKYNTALKWCGMYLRPAA